MQRIGGQVDVSGRRRAHDADHAEHELRTVRRIAQHPARRSAGGLARRVHLPRRRAGRRVARRRMERALPRRMRARRAAFNLLSIRPDGFVIQ